MVTPIFQMLLVNCLLRLAVSSPEEINATQSHVVQDQTNKEMYIPIPVNNDKFNKLSININNRSTTTANNTKQQQQSNNNHNVEKELKNKKSFDELEQQSDTRQMKYENTPPPHHQQQQQLQHHHHEQQHQQLIDEDRLYPINTNVLLNRVYNLNSNMLRRQTKVTTQHGPIKTIHDLHTKRLDNDDQFLDDDDDDDDDDIDDGGQYDYYTNKLKRITSLAELLGAYDMAANKRRYNPQNIFNDQMRLPQEVIDLPSITADYDEDGVFRNDDNIEMEADDVMDSNDLAEVMMMMEETGVSYLDNYISNAINRGLLDPRFASVYRSSVIKEYTDLLHRHHHHHHQDVEEPRQEKERNLDLVQYLSKEIPELKYGSMLSAPKIVKKVSTSAANDRQQELEEFASILKQVNLENELETLAKKYSE